MSSVLCRRRLFRKRRARPTLPRIRGRHRTRAATATHRTRRHRRLENPMNVIAQPRPEPTPFPGIAHATWAGEADGLTQLSVWRQTLQPGAATPPHRHDCDEVVLCTSGDAELQLGADVRRFGAGATLVLPAGLTHQIVNTGSRPLEILGIFGATPVGTALPDGTALALPWRS
ncbi:MAG: cupin domain-containing protein [Comamonadaceae bacterium]|nr:cupin domain-containing protein [Comamonadaceae bacterium]